MVVNIKTKAVEVQHDLPFDAAKPVHPQFRRIRYTAQGTYLVPFLNMNKVVEYDKDFKEIWKLRDQDALGRHPPQERQHADYRRRR